ncbi:hypothetical protein [Kolpuevirus frurule]|uniref:Right handed beta helix domain-containing protein n=1 Tax=Kolpuevirus sp. 'frurule' TaxID=3028514 RepID=A0AAF0DNK0_9CAUD|nr:hypothetical protein [Kolpuevirus sp. 'frurule']
MMENQQLIKKDRSANSYSKIFPWTFTDLVLDRVTKESLDNILVRNNFIALPYVGSKAATRLQVPMKNRRRGIWLSYIDYAGTLTVEYYNDNNLDDNHWQDSSYWLPYNTAEFQPASVGLSALAQEVFDWINSQITTAVKLNPEDLQKNSSGQIEEANRAYDTSTFSGLGYRILRKNIQSNKNILTQSMINMPNNVYKIRYDFDLNGATINLPANSVLQFVGGSIKNGTLNGNNTVIKADSNAVIFDSVVIEGTWNVEHIYDSWFAFNTSPSYISNQIITNILALSNDDVYNTIHFDADRTYYFELPYKGRANFGDDVRPNYWKLNTEEYAFLRIFTGVTSNTHLIFNNTLQMIPTNQGAYFIFHIESKENIQISGTGTINGDAKDHLYTDPFAGNNYYGEWGHVLNFRSCNDVIIRDITVGYAFGDGISLGNASYNNNGTKAAGLATKNVTVDGVKVLYARRNGISLGGNNYSITNVYFEGNGSDTIRGTAPMAAIDFENDYVDIEPSGLCKNVSMSNCKFKDNKYDVSSTIRDDLYEVPRGELVNISDCNFTSPLRLNRTNGLTFSNCHIVGITNVDNSVAAWYSSKDLIFSNCIFDELNPYLTISAEEQDKKFINPTYPEDIRYTTTFQQNMAVGRALKFTIPKPLVGEVEFTAFCSNSNYSLIQMPINTTVYTFGPSPRLTGIRDVKIKASQDSTPRYFLYKNTPVFSYINYTEDTNNFIIYFAIGGSLINDSLAGSTSVNIFLTSKTKFITIEAPVSGRPDYAGMYGGKWSQLSSIVKESIKVSDIPETVTFPSKELYEANLLADMPDNLTSDKVGKSVFVLDDTYRRPAFWDSYSNTFRTADGNRLYERAVTSQLGLDALTAKLDGTADRGYIVYITTFDSYLTWDGARWLNEDGSLFSKVKFIKATISIDTLNILFSYNVTYKIVGNIDLDGGTLTIATGSILDFQGGSFSNGTITLSNTELKGNVKLSSITLAGSCSNDITKLSWFTDDLANDYSANLQSLVNVTKVQGTVDIDSLSFIVNTTVNITKALTIRGNGTRNYYNLNIGSIRNKITTANDIVILNITSTQVRVEGITFIGAYSTLDPTTGVRLGTQALVSFSNASNCTLRNCNFLYSHIGALFTNSGIANIEDNNFAGCNAGLRLMASPDSNLINNYFNTNSGNVTFSEDNAGTLNGVGLSINASSGNINVIGGKCEWNNKGMVIANSMGVAIIGVQFDWNKSGNVIYNQTSYSLDSSILSHSITGCRFLGTPADQHIYIRYWSAANLNVCGCTFTKNASDVTAIDTSTGANEGPESIFKVVQKQEADEYRTKIHINFKGNTIYRVVNLVNAVIQSTTPGSGQLVVVSADGQTLGKIGSCTIINNIDVAKGTSQWRETAIVTNNLSTDDAGLTYFDTDLNKLVLWNGTAWTNVDGSTLA